MSTSRTHSRQASLATISNRRAALAQAYSSLAHELSDENLKVVGNYVLGPTLGEGAYGLVRMATHRLTSARVAIKIVSRRCLNNSSPEYANGGKKNSPLNALTREIHHHRSLPVHPNILQLLEIIATENSIYLVSELCEGGELYDKLVLQNFLPEWEARRIFGELLLALHCCHTNGVVHRDIKLENILLDADLHVKLADFGFARDWESNRLMETWCGTTGYASPEMLRGDKYGGRETDIWSAGVVLFALVAGSLPFDDDDEDVMKTMILENELPIPDHLSNGLVDLLSKILNKSSHLRPSIPDILAHPWFSAEAQSASRRRLSSDNHTLTTIHEPGAHRSSLNVKTPEFASHSFSLSNPSTSNSKSPNLSKVNSSRRLSSDSSNTNNHLSPHFPSTFHRNSSTSAFSVSSRTPTRTKRRSISSQLSFEGLASPALSLSFGQAAVNWTQILNTPPPAPFSTTAEIQLLRDLQSTGVDTRQLEHSVRTKACDSSAGLWWTLLHKTPSYSEASNSTSLVSPPSIVVAITPPGSPFKAVTHVSPSKNKTRSASISMLQRATSALGAGILVRKKSTDGLKERSPESPQAVVAPETSNPRDQTSSNYSKQSPGSSLLYGEGETETDALSALPSAKSSRSRNSLLNTFSSWFGESRRKKAIPVSSNSNFLNKARRPVPIKRPSQEQAAIHHVQNKPLGSDTRVLGARSLSRRSSSVSSRHSNHSFIINTPRIGGIAHSPANSRPNSVVSIRRRSHRQSPSGSSLESMGIQSSSRVKTRRSSSIHSQTTRVIRQIAYSPRSNSPRSVSAGSLFAQLPLSSGMQQRLSDEGAVSIRSGRSGSSSRRSSNHRSKSLTGKQTELVASKRTSPFSSPPNLLSRRFGKVPSKLTMDVFGDSYLNARPTAKRPLKCDDDEWEDLDGFSGGLGQAKVMLPLRNATSKTDSPAAHAVQFASAYRGTASRQKSPVMANFNSTMSKFPYSNDLSTSSISVGNSRRNAPNSRGGGVLYSTKTTAIAEDEEDGSGEGNADVMKDGGDDGNVDCREIVGEKIQTSHLEDRKTEEHDSQDQLISPSESTLDLGIDMLQVSVALPEVNDDGNHVLERETPII